MERAYMTIKNFTDPESQLPYGVDNFCSIFVTAFYDTVEGYLVVSEEPLGWDTLSADLAAAWDRAQWWGWDI